MLRPAYVIRDAGSNDAPAVGALFNEASIANWTRPLGVSEEQSAAAWPRTIREGQVLTAWDGDELCGCSAFWSGQVCFAVMPARRSRGLASTLLASSIEQFSSGNRRHLHALVRRGNDAAQATLLKYGFRFAGLLQHRNGQHAEMLARFMR